MKATQEKHKRAILSKKPTLQKSIRKILLNIIYDYLHILLLFKYLLLSTTFARRELHTAQSHDIRRDIRTVIDRMFTTCFHMVFSGFSGVSLVSVTGWMSKTSFRTFSGDFRSGFSVELPPGGGRRPDITREQNSRNVRLGSNTPCTTEGETVKVDVHHCERSLHTPWNII